MRVPGGGALHPGAAASAPCVTEVPGCPGTLPRPSGDILTRGRESSSHLLSCSPPPPVSTSPGSSEQDGSGTPWLGAGLGPAQGQESRVSLYPTFRGEEIPEGWLSHSPLFSKLQLPGW